MRNALRNTKIYFIAIIIASGLYSCTSNEQQIEIKGEAQGTFYTIKYLSPDGREILDKAYFDRLFARIDSSLSIYKDYSLVNEFNRSDSMVISDPWFIQMVLQSDKIYRESDGEFDPTVVHLVNAWGFGPSSRNYVGQVPLDSLMKITGWDKIEFKMLPDGKMLLKKKVKGVIIGFNAIAQGYAADIIGEGLEKHGIKNYLVDAGGELKASGHNRLGESWKIGIDRPVSASLKDREIVAIFPLENRSVSTSGSYRKYYEINGVKYSHAISPKTGRPVEHNLLSVTVVADSCSLADGYSTAIMIMGVGKGKEFLKKHPELEAYLIFSDSKGNLQTYVTRQMGTVLKEY